MTTETRDPLAAEFGSAGGASETGKTAGRGAADAGSTNAARAVRAAWERLGERERRLVSLLGAVAVALLVWALAVRPAWNAVDDSVKRLPELDAQLEDMQKLAVESRELRGTSRLQPSQATAALRAATDTLGATGKLTLAGERATLTLTGASGDQLQRWLVDARTTARARTIEAKLTRAAAGFSGTVVVALPAAN